MATPIGYSNYTKSRLDNLEDRTHILDDLMAERRAVIAHRFSKHTAQPYSLSLLRNIIDRGIRLIEIDVNETKDTDPNDRVFYLSHGDMEEVAPEDRPAQITKDNFNKSIINFNNQGLHNGDTLPSLKEAWNFLKGENVLILMESKTTNYTGLLAYCQEIGMTPEYMVFQDFDPPQLNLFKEAGYKTMYLKNSALTQSEVDNYDYFCCNTSNISTFQEDSKITQFIYYTDESPAQHQEYLNNNSKLCGCFSDCALPTYKQLAVNDMTLLDPDNGYVSVIQESQNISKHTRITANKITGHILLDFNRQANPTANQHTYTTFHGFKMAFQGFYTWSLENLTGSGNDWIGISLRLGGDYLEKDNNSTRKQAVNIIFRNNLDSEIYTLLNGDFSQEFSPTGKNAYTRTSAEKYITIRWTTTGSGTNFRLSVYFSDILGDPVSGSNLEVNIPINTTNLPHYNFMNGNTDVFWSVKRDDTTEGRLIFYDRTYE
jgi:hypothetical protein